ncbi:nucleotidyltransferase family protein [Glaciecola petra]|uniref:Nucleotidyltransferase family protein n=1 Tax=Glaciecola petra TaxID=3075602 RepID=A0ABU2ZLW8_9ALTE|nr:nucleotidyltransferase family protein [Aestuariibacter sp. P117]MDT0593624.1 nucleotidyltransferase family protein [Aestuariibacter sp. P117]
MNNAISKSTFLSCLTKGLTEDHSLINNEQTIDAFLRNILKAQLHGFVSQKLTLSQMSKLPKAFALHMRSVQQFSFAQQTQTQLACTQLADALLHSGIKVTLLKGAAYILGEKQNALGRLISDIDILVPKLKMPQLEAFLKDNGWQAVVLEDYDEKYYREWSHELPPYTHLESGVTLDIHHTLIPESSGKIINVDLLFENSTQMAANLFVPDNCHLVLHSAIHLLLNDDIEKGLRDCFDLHLLLTEIAKQDKTTDLVELFIQSNCERELVILLNLLTHLFDKDTQPYCKLMSDKIAQLTPFEKIKVTCLYHAIFPQSRYLENSTNSLARFYVYTSGHLSKMPLPKFIKHITYKTYRGIVKKLLGAHVFAKSPQ